MAAESKNCKTVMTASKVKLSDGKGVGGIGRLTDAKIDRIQTYYGYAIRNNKHDEKLIQDAIWAIFYHTITGPPTETLTTNTDTAWKIPLTPGEISSWQIQWYQPVHPEAMHPLYL